MAEPVVTRTDGSWAGNLTAEVIVELLAVVDQPIEDDVRVETTGQADGQPVQLAGPSLIRVSSSISVVRSV